MKKTILKISAGILAGCIFISGSVLAASDVNTQNAYLAFHSQEVDITDGHLSWDEENGTWTASLPSMYGEVILKGTFDKDGVMTITEDSSGGYASGDLPLIQEVFTEALNGHKTAPLSFQSQEADVKGGLLNWDENTGKWTASMPSIYGEVLLSGTYAEDGTMVITEDSSGGYASADLPIIQEIFADALSGIYQASSSALEDQKEENDLSLAIESRDDIDNMWKSTVADIARGYNPDDRNHDVVFYGASNFAYWTSMEEDLMPYSVQNHAFGGSTDKDLLLWAEYMLYPYEPQIVFFQTGSNDYVTSEAETDELKVAEAMSFKKEMFAELHEHMPDAVFVVMSGILLPGRAEYVDMTLDINDQLKTFCEETDYMRFIDAESLTYNRETKSFVDNVESLFNDDQIHLTDASRIVWAENWIKPAMEELNAPTR